MNSTKRIAATGKPYRTHEGCYVSRHRVMGEGGAITEHIELWTELELAPDKRELVIERSAGRAP